MAFTRNRPTATEFLSVSQPVLYNNFNSSDDTMGIDHYPFSDTTAQNGQHKIIHQYQATLTRSGVGAVIANFPGATAQTNQLFSAAYTPDTSGAVADTQLFNLTGNGGLSQLTGNLATSDGWCWVGGILLQWGKVSLSSSSSVQGSVTLKNRVPGAIPFPNNLWNVQATLHCKNGTQTGNSQNVSIFTLTTGSFFWNYTGGSPYDSFYWLAIGN